MKQDTVIRDTSGTQHMWVSFNPRLADSICTGPWMGWELTNFDHIWTINYVQSVQHTREHGHLYFPVPKCQFCITQCVTNFVKIMTNLF